MEPRTLIGLGTLVGVLAIAPLAAAEQNQTTGGGTLSAQARIDFRVVVSRFLLLRVGSTKGIDNIRLNVAAANVADGTDVTATPTSGELGGGQITARIVSNAGQISIAPTSGGAGLSNRSGDTIPYTELLETTNNGSLPTPNLTNGGGSSVNVALNGGAGTTLTRQSAVWSYTHANPAVFPVGTYGAGGGRVTYTASSP